MNTKYKLCYVDLPWCYFTTKELSEQWGDDWNDAPYEHNAGAPYIWRDESDGDRYDVKKVSVDTGLIEPCAYVANSKYSVEMINRGDVPWLQSDEWEKNKIEIMAGTLYPDFIRMIQSDGGTVYELAARVEAE